MIKKIWQYWLATRPVEATLMIGFPLIGMFLGLSAWHQVGWLLLKFYIATYPLVMYVYCLNSYGGLEHDRINQRLSDNPAVTGEVTPFELLILTYGGAFFSGLLYFLWFPGCLFPWLLIIFNWTLYSHPSIYAKARPITGTSIHFLGGILQFLLGWGAVHSIDGHSILIAIYFSLIFSAGHLNHEVKDHDPDKAAGLTTNAVAFGPEKVFSFAFGVFTFAFFYLLILSLFKILAWRYALPYLAIYPFHLLLHRQATHGAWTGYNRMYQVVYRTLFVTAGAILVLAKWWSLD